jgi:hypothetical protein
MYETREGRESPVFKVIDFEHCTDGQRHRERERERESSSSSSSRKPELPYRDVLDVYVFTKYPEC